MGTQENPMALGLEQGVLALLSSKSTKALLSHVPHASDLVLACCALTAILRALPPRTAVAGRVSGIMTQVLFTIALNTVLEWVGTGTDVAIASAGLLAAYFAAQSLDVDGQIASTAQYLLVARLSETMRPYDRGEMLAVAWVLAFPARSKILPPDAAQLAQLVTAESLSAWLRGWFPPSLLLPSTAVLLYLCAPFVDAFPALQRVYRFAVFAFTADTQLSLVPTWLLGAALWALWQVEADPVSRRLAAIAGSNAAVLVTLDAMRFTMDADPAPTLLALLVAVQILEEANRTNHRKNTG